MWLNYDTQTSMNSYKLWKCKLLILESIVVFFDIHFLCYNTKYYQVGIICIFIININSWKFQVSSFNHFRIPLSQFWFSNWNNNPVYTVHNHFKNEAIYSVTWWNVIHTSIRIETVKFLCDWTMILKFSWVHISCENANY